MGNILTSQARKGINTKLFFIGLFLFQLVIIFQGIDLSDEGFIATYYQQIFSNPESVQYNFMFWLTGIIGGIYLKLFSFLGLWGLRLGGVLVTTCTALLVYNLLKEYLNRNSLKLSLFLIIITLNNDIKELNYNNLSALFYVTIIYFLFKGVKGKSNLKLFISGAFVSINFFVRPPNVLELGFVLAIIYYGYEINSKPKYIAMQVSSFLTGFVLCLVILLTIMYSLGHWNIYLHAIQLLYKMGKGNQHVEIQSSDYGILKLLNQFKSNNAKSLFIALSIIASLLLGISFFASIKKKVVVLNKIGKLLQYLFIFLIFGLIVRGAIDYFFILYFYSGIIIIAFALSFLTPTDLNTRFLLFCGCFILISFPFGSSAGILTAGRYAFWIGLPIAINYFFNIESIKNEFTFYRGNFKSSLNIHIAEREINSAKYILITVLVFIGLFHSYSYPFFDKRNRMDMHYSVDNKYLTGIFTTRGRAEALNELLHESSKYVKKGDYVLAYDCIPLYHFLTESVPYIRSAYPWLYETELFNTELLRAKSEKKILPVVVMQTIKTIGDGSKWPEEALPEDYSKWDVNQGRNKYMNDFLANNSYKEVWSNRYFRIYIPPESHPLTLK